MGSLTNYAENALLNHLTRNSAYSPAATLYLALCTADPTDAATGASMNEVANIGGYARTAITFSAASSRRVEQDGAVTFPTASGGWGTVTHWAIVDSATHGAGNVLAYGAFTTGKSIVSGNTPSISSEEIYIEFATETGFSDYAANGFLDRMFRNQAFIISANYLALCTAAPEDDSTGSTITEPSGNAYARVQINANGGGAPDWTTVSGGAVENDDAIMFLTASGSWGTITHWALCDASSNGNLLWYGSVTSQAVEVDDTASFPAGSLELSAS